MSKLTLKGAKLKADRIFSLFIRKRDNGVCYTCGKVGEIKEMQCGHYISRNYLSTRFDEQNCHCQCVGCNVFKKGNYTVYAVNLEKQYGNGILQELEHKKNEMVKFSISDYEELIKKYENS